MLLQPHAVRVLAVCVAALVAANLAVVISATDDRSGGGSTATPTDGELSEDDAETRVVITAADGSTVTVDPSTAEGQAAIEAAERRGETMQTISNPRSSRNGGRRTADPGSRGSEPGASASGSDGADLKAGSGGASTSTTLPGVPGQVPTGGVIDEVNRVVDDVEGRVNDVVDDVEDRVNDVVDDVEDRVNDVVDDVEDTVNDVVDDVEDTVNDVTDELPPVSVPGVPVTVTVPPVTVPPVTVPPVTVPPITVPPLTLPPTTVPPLFG